MSHKTLDKLAKEQASLFALVEPLSEEQLDRQHGDGWTVREILTHLWNAEEDHCRVISVIARGDGDKIPTEFNLAHHNDQRLTERGHLSKADLLAGLQAQRVRTEGLFARMTDEQMEISGRHPALGEMSVGNIFRIIGIHEKSHIQEITEALKA